MSDDATPKTLIIVRHAKAEAGSAAEDDAKRRLTKDGEQAAIHVGRYLHGAGYCPEWTLCSAAARTMQTLEGIEVGYGRALPQENSEAFYHAGLDEWLNAIAMVAGTVSTLLIVGHNPAMHSLACTLAKHGNDKQLDDLGLRYLPATLTVLRFDNSHWRTLRHAAGQLVDLHLAPTLQIA